MIRAHGLLACLCAILILFLPGMQPPRAQGAVQVEIIDGDTLRMGGQTVRIMGLDAPEMNGRCEKERTLAALAKLRLVDLLHAGAIIEVAPRRDRYNRLLAVVRDPDGRDVAPIMIEEGLARSYDGTTRRQGWC